MSAVPQFMSTRTRREDSWRGVILFGRNVATYKFCVARALLELAPSEGQLLKLDELAVPYSRHLCEHLRHSSKQGTFSTSRFLDACRQANEGGLSPGKLIEATVRFGFENVIDAFHIVARKPVPERFFVDERATHGGIRITEAFSRLLCGLHADNLSSEVESRWRLTETAFALNVCRSLIMVRHDSETQSLFVVDPTRRRRSITGAREALSGYQKGHCFYCFEPFSLSGFSRPDVDHFFPHCLQVIDLGAVVDGVWNLVLACRDCNRGAGGKSDRIPTLELLQRLHTRNEFLIASHHPLRETLLRQTGVNVEARRGFLNSVHSTACAALFHQWRPEERGEALF